MAANSLGKCATVRQWTDQAEECYSRGCVCEGCSINSFIFTSKDQKCKMKVTVLELVRKFGAPKCQKQMVIE